jgi:hypothetical protein
LQLRAGELGWPAGDRTGAQGVQAAVAIFGHPGEDGGAGQAQGLGDGFRVGARLELLDRPDAELFQVLWSSLRPSLSRMAVSNLKTARLSSYLQSPWYLEPACSGSGRC